MKKHNIFKVVCITILIAVVLTWILPSTYYSQGVIDNGRMQIGIFDLFSYLTALLSYFGYVPLYILAVGGFYGVLYQTSGYRNLLDKIVKKYKGNEWIFLTLVMIVFAVVTSVSGLSLGLFFLFPFVITAILLMGYSKVTALLTTVGSVCVGLLGTTYSASEMGIISETLSLPASSEIITKIIILVIGIIILVVNTLLYAKKHRISTPRKGFLYPESTNAKSKSWPIALVFDLVLIIMILSFISWTGVFSVDIFDKALESIQSFKIGGFPLFEKLLGQVATFGNWQVTDLITLVVVAAGFIALLCKVKFDDMVKGFGSGAKRFLRPAFVATIVYLIVFISAYHPLTLTIIKPIVELTDSFNVVTASFAGIIAHLFNVEMYYSATSVLPYMTSVFTDSSIYNVIALVWQGTYGLTMLFVPTSVILVASLSYLNVSYFKWLKAIWKLLLQLLVVLLIVFLIILMI